MVCYCFVKGCGNSSKTKKNNPGNLLSFHGFPCNPELKSKWLKAIGRPNWDPPRYAAICSVHFTSDQLNYEGSRIRTKDDAIPTVNLPLNSNFEATNIEVCRICLATDLKMYSLQDSHLKHCIDSVVGLKTNHIEGLPQYVCYECAACLIRCNKLVEKSMIAQATLLDIFVSNGEITKVLIKELDRKNLNLASSLGCYPIKNNQNYEYQEHTNTMKDTSPLAFIDHIIDSYFPSEDDDSDLEIKKYQSQNEINVKTEIQINEINQDESEDNSDLDVKDAAKINETKIYETEGESDYDVKTEIKKNHETYDDSDVDVKPEIEVNEMEINERIVEISDDHLDDCDMESPVAESISDTDLNKTEENIFKCSNIVKKSLKTKERRVRKRPVKKEIKTTDEMEMRKHFDLVKLSLEEQIEEWKKITDRKPPTNKTTYKCEVCLKVFMHLKTYREHTANHNPSHGKVECAVCKLRFKSQVFVNMHANRAHANMYHCKACPQVFSQGAAAKKHHRWHAICKYKCPSCPYRGTHESAVAAHARSAHAREHACAQCGRACHSRRGLEMHQAAAHKDVKAGDIPKEYRCEECDINFASEGARRVHLLTSNQHKEKTELIATPGQMVSRNTCSKCGVKCSTRRELVAHSRAEHPRPKKRRWPKYGIYPTACQLCGEMMSCRREHWHHFRRDHPKEISTYQPVVTAVCDTCGKRFQTAAQLQIHQLRHQAPTVRCPTCPKLFYDKYALQRHAAAHESTKPYQCRTCGKAFKVRFNLERHAAVHTDATPHECPMCGNKFKHASSVKLHIRNVHFKVPQPPRKRRNKATRDINITADDIK